MLNASGTKLQVLSPEGAPAAPDPVAPVPGLGDLHARQLALLSNTKPNIDLLLQTYADLLQERFATGATHQRKVNAAVGGGSLIDELAAHSDAAITGIADCGACTAQTARDTVAFEERGIPAVVVTTTAFQPLVVHQTRYCGAERVKMIVLPHPFDVLRPDEVVERAKGTVDELITLLRDGGGRDVA